MSGRRPPRNTDYNRALTVLLARLGALNAVLADALVDSRRTQGLRVPEANRTLIDAPIRLALETDIDALRRRLGHRTGEHRSARGRQREGIPPSVSGCGSTSRVLSKRMRDSWHTLSVPLVHSSNLRFAQGQASVSPAQQVEEVVRYAAGKVARPGRGQGFQLDQDVKVAVEAHAMNAASKFYSVGWRVEDVHGTESYDLVCRRGAEVKHVE